MFLLQKCYEVFSINEMACHLLTDTSTQKRSPCTYSQVVIFLPISQQLNNGGIYMCWVLYPYIQVGTFDDAKIPHALNSILLLGYALFLKDLCSHVTSTFYHCYVGKLRGRNNSICVQVRILFSYSRPFQNLIILPQWYAAHGFQFARHKSHWMSRTYIISIHI